MSSATSLIDALRINFIGTLLYIYIACSADPFHTVNGMVDKKIPIRTVLLFHISLDKYNFIVILNVISAHKKTTTKKQTNKKTGSFTEYP